MNTRKLILSAVLVLSLAVGVSAVLAQDTDDPTPATPPTQQWGFRGPRGPMMGEGFQGRFGQHGPMMAEPGQFGQRGPMMGRQVGPRGLMAAGAGVLHDLVEEYTGLDHTALREARLSGQTLADLITANGQSVDDFIAAAVEQASARIDGMLENGFITAERADELKALAQERITAMVNGEMGGLMFGWI